MRYSANTPRAAKYITPFTDASQLDSLDVPYGQVSIDYLDGCIYTKDIYGTVYQLGNSYRYLASYPEYFDSGYDYGLLRFRYKDDGQLGITVEAAGVSIWDLGGTYRDISIPLTDSYLGYSSTLAITHKDSLQFSLTSLADVNIRNLGSSVHNWVLCTQTYYGKTYRDTINYELKDELGPQLYYAWSLAPEASTIRGFDDAGIEPESANQIYRIVKPGEGRYYKYVNANLSIVFDSAPKLASNLNCDSQAVFNQTYQVREETVNTSVASVTIDVSTGEGLIINAAQCTLLQLSILVPNTSAPSTFLTHVIIKGFKGAIDTSSYCIYENGKAPIFIGDTVLLSIISHSHPLPYSIIMQKSLSLR